MTTGDRVCIMVGIDRGKFGVISSGPHEKRLFRVALDGPDARYAYCYEGEMRKVETSAAEEVVFDPEALSGISFFDAASNCTLRYIYPNAGHWTAGWLVVKNTSGRWMTMRKASDDDIAKINEAVSKAHHD